MENIQTQLESIIEEGGIGPCRPLTDHLRDGKNWLNGGECCGQKDSSGTCAAPACVFGDALKWFFEAADEIDRQAAMRHSDQRAVAGIVNESCELRVKLESIRLELDAMTRQRDLALAKRPMKLHFTNDWLKAKIEQDGDDFPETVP